MIIKEKAVHNFLLYGSIIGVIVIATVLYQSQVKKKVFIEKKP